MDPLTMTIVPHCDSGYHHLEVYKAHLIKWSGQGKSRIVAVKTLRGNHHVIIMITRHMNILSF